jgi:hypothetical protein
MSENKTLGDALPEEIKRVQELRELYLTLGPVGQFGAMLMQNSIDEAMKAMIEGDLGKMIVAYEDLKGFTE